jgi:hypothetical protein
MYGFSDCRSEPSVVDTVTPVPDSTAPRTLT